jgi:hypothetical protein
MMALNSGDMLYYDGTKWVNSSTLVTSISGTNFQIQDAGTTNLVRPISCSHTTSGTIAGGFGAGIQFASTGEIGDIDCHVGAASPLASYFSLQAYNQSGALTEMLRLGSTGSAPAAFFTVPLVGLLVPLQLNREVFSLSGKASPYTLLNSDYMNPILEFTSASAAMTIVFPATTYPGAFWIIYNRSGQTLTLNPGSLTLNNNLHALYYADGTNLQQVTTPA